MKTTANCKLNLHLRVTGKLPDGYHSLETIFHEIPFGDELDIELSDDGKLHFSSSGIEIPDGGNNICVKAAEILKIKHGIKDGCRIHLQKNVPIGAGLGGGSSDAAAVLKSLNDLWGIGSTEKELEKMGLELGADVPFFIRGGCAWGEGKGELLRPMNPVLENGTILLIYPHLHINTSWAYKNLNLNLTKTADNVIFAEVSKLRAPLRHYFEGFFNDFEAVVFEKYPEIEKIKEFMINEGADFSAMSGSGSTVFGFFTNEKMLEHAIRIADKNYFVKAIKL
ncbi:MAG: 4-(cytidine 5'-diphospho)-2-C-methyl-D-erythritol kinase [Candidatus Delongbacteria bacterium]|nr:4-(cytidine 5'-diphospho)-2-C-methyl-D-erythritol kinase [Candidatus Delongbacteria bacterium]